MKVPTSDIARVIETLPVVLKALGLSSETPTHFRFNDSRCPKEFLQLVIGEEKQYYVLSFRPGDFMGADFYFSIYMVKNGSPEFIEDPVRKIFMNN